MEKLGLSALVTRPREEAESLIPALAIRAIEAVVEPLIGIHYQAPQALDLIYVAASAVRPPSLGPAPRTPRRLLPGPARSPVLTYFGYSWSIRAWSSASSKAG